MNRPSVTEFDLHAYADGFLPAGRREEVEAYLADKPAERERVEGYRLQKRLLKASFDDILHEPLPARLAEAAVAKRGFGLPLWRFAAGFALVCIGVAAGWIARGLDGADDRALVVARETSLPRQAAVAHVVFSPDVRRPVEIGAEQEDQLVAWLSKRLGSPIRPPKLGALGYELIGGRLLPGASGPVAQFMYHDVTGQRLTLYVSSENAANRDTAFRFAQEGPVNVFYWIDGKFGYALSAGTGKAELARVATAVYEQLEKK